MLASSWPTVCEYIPCQKDTVFQGNAHFNISTVPLPPSQFSLNLWINKSIYRFTNGCCSLKLRSLNPCAIVLRNSPCFSRPAFTIVSASPVAGRYMRSDLGISTLGPAVAPVRCP